MAANNTITQLVRDTYTAFDRSYTERHRTFVRLAKRCNDFVMGDQWDEALKKQIEGNGFPALTLNQILQVYGAIRGQYTTRQVDFQVKARKHGATHHVATILSELIDIVLDDNNYHTDVEPTLFDDGIIETRGILDVRMSYDDNPMGEISIKTIDPKSVVISADAVDYDPKTWPEVFIERWMSLDDIDDFYGEPARKKLEAHISGNIILAESNFTYHNTYDATDSTFGGDGFMRWIPTGGPGMINRIRAMRIIERQYKRMRKMREFISPMTGDTRTIPDYIDDNHAKAIAQQYGLQIRIVRKQWTRIVVIADSTLIYDDWAPDECFTIIPFFPVFRRGKSTGPIAHLLDSQEFFNKIESQFLRSVNSAANSGWQYEAGAIINMTDEEFAANSSKDGLTIVRKAGSAPAQKIDPNLPASGIETAGRDIYQMIRNISGIESLLGSAPSPELAGVTLQGAQTAAAGTLQVFFDNLMITRRMLGDRILDLVQSHYTEPRIFRATELDTIDLDELTAGLQNPDDVKQAVQRELAINLHDVGRIINDVTMGEYSLELATVPRRDTINDMQFSQLIELRKAGINIPDYRILERSNLFDRESLVQESKRAQGFAPPTPAEAQLQMLRLREMMAQIAEAESRAQEFASQAALNQAKAQSLGFDAQLNMQQQQVQDQMEAARLVADLQKFKANLQNKLDLAQIHVNAKLENTRVGQVNKQASLDKQHTNDMQRDALAASLKTT